MYLYIHGFLSSSQSSKAQQFKNWLEEQGRIDEWVCPDLPVNPEEAMQILVDYIESAKTPVKLVGSSLGGFYATVLSERYNIKAIVINPAVHAGLILKYRIGTHKMWHSNETVEFTQTHVDTLNAMDLPIIQHPDNLLVLLEKGDEVLDYRWAESFYSDCNQFIFNGGNHSFTRLEQLFEFIDRF